MRPNLLAPIAPIDCAPPRRRLLRPLLDTLWQQPLWAVPFALFFGTIGGMTPRIYLRAYLASLVFAYAIRVCIVLHVAFVVPVLRRRFARGRRIPIWIEASGYGAASMTGSYLATWILSMTLFPGMLRSAQSVIASGAFAIVFTALFGGIAYAVHFYRESVRAARDVARMRAELAEAELRALRAQINPHFLFNSLNTIASLIASNPDIAEDTTTRLADVFRYALHASERAEVTLGEELAFLRTYLGIERTRFGDRLRVVDSIGPGLEAARVPSLLLQPLVENAVRHAVAPRHEGGCVTLSAARDGDLLTLEVRDDGPGFDPAPTPPPTEDGGFGLHSVRERLRAAGPPHALAIDSDRGGARIRITLPFRNDTGTAHHPNRGEAT